MTSPFPLLAADTADTATAAASVGAWVSQIMSFFVFVLVLMALGLLASRMMGVSFNLPRLAFAGAVGMALGGLVGILVQFDTLTDAASLYPEQEMGPQFLAIVVGAMALASLLVFVAVELVLPQGTRLRPVAALRAAVGWSRRMGRYRRIVWILARHGLWGYVTGRRAGGEDASTQRRLARSIARSAEEAGVVFVKLGQVLATRRDLLPPVFVEELGRLHSDVAPVPLERIGESVESELGNRLEDLFEEFSPEPLAAASIAQVHTARLHGSEEVVVKVQRPGVETVVRRDLDIIRRLARRFGRDTDWGRAVGVVDLAEGFAEALLEELDFEVEAANIAAVTEAAADTPVRVPRVHDAYTTPRVLVMERLNGTPLSSADLDDPNGPDRTGLARTLLDCLLGQIMVGGIFHADPHPGNILLLDGGGVGLLDYGSVGRLDGETREALRMMLLAIDRNDAALLTDTLLDVVEEPGDVDEERLKRALGQFMARYLSNGTTASMRMFTELMLIVTRFGLALRTEIAAVFRALATLEGTLVHLSPGFDTVGEARRFAEESMGEAVTATGVRETAMAELAALLPTLRRMPRRVDRITDQMHKGRFTVRLRPFAHPEDRAILRGLAQQAVLTVLAVATGLISVGLFNVTDGPEVVWSALSPRVRVLNVLAWLLLATSTMMILRLLVGVARDGVRAR
ncbi:ABC1 kinase family protein [Nocardiopsis aegyptia]|uniref:ABC1 kinase family protein n=1 Tax=Nocardiopsis aegyptia TaxID=220378 RepID=UPI0036700755